MTKKSIILMMMVMFIVPFVNADIIIPTVTNVYFEQNGQAYNGNIEFTVKGYGYTTGMPGNPDFNPDKEPGTYTPEVVFSFTATYDNYGDKIYENYYRNYRHIDYYELEGKTSNGKTFIIKNIKKVPNNCYEFIEKDGIYYSDITNCLRKPYSEFPDDISPFDYCKDTFVKVEKEIDEKGDLIENICELKFDLDNAKWDGQNVPEPKPELEPKGFWNKVSCFFKRLFDGSC